jgi:putative acetyltransferase
MSADRQNAANRITYEVNLHCRYPPSMIRDAIAEDAKALACIRIAAINELATVAYSEQQVRAWLAGPSAGDYEAAIANKIILVEEVHGNVLAFAQLDDKHGVVERMYVSPQHARQGAGTRLLRALEVIAREKGLAMLSLDATLNAVAFYTSIGYASVALCEHKLQHGIVFPCMSMLKKLHREGG